MAHNICLPNLVLKLAPSLERPAYLATADALGSLFHAASTIGGGVLFDWLAANSPNPSWEPYRSCLIILFIGLAMRSLGVVLLTAIHEPGAWKWREIIASRLISPG